MTRRTCCPVTRADVTLYVLGLYRYTYRGATLIRPKGGVPGFRTIMAFLPGKDWGGCYLH